MNANDQKLCKSIEAVRTTKGALVAALTETGGVRVGRSDRFRLPKGGEVVIVKRGTAANSYGLIFDVFAPYWAQSLTSSVLADYRDGNVTTIHA